MPMGSAIVMEDLRKQYGDLVAVDGLSLAVEQGEVFGLLGPNGAGKTTTIRMLVGLTEPDGGRAAVNGFDVIREPVKMKAGVGVVPELSNLYPELTCLDNLLYTAELYGVPRRERLARSEALLEQVGLTEKRNAGFGKLSRGMKRRLTIAAALVHRPAVLFLDEPITGLDVFSARSLRGLVRELNAGGTTIVLTTHLIAEADELCHRIGLLVKGRLMALDSPAALKARVAAEQRLWVELDSAPPATALEQLGVVASLSPAKTAGNRLLLSAGDVHAALQEVMAWSVSHGLRIRHLATQPPTLEEAFVRLTGIDADVMTVDKSQKPAGGG